MLFVTKVSSKHIMLFVSSWHYFRSCCDTLYACLLSISLMFIFTVAAAQFCAWKGKIITLTSSTALSLTATLG